MDLDIDNNLDSKRIENKNSFGKLLCGNNSIIIIVIALIFILCCCGKKDINT